jgi:uncharacterized protein (DUF58 family)
MMRRITRLNVATLTVIAWALWLGVLTGRAEMFLVTLPLLIGTVWVRFRTAPPHYSLTHEISTARLFEADHVTVTVTLCADSPLPQVEIFEPLPASVKGASGNRIVLALDRGQTHRWSYEIRFDARTRVALGTLHLRSWEPSGLGVCEAIHRDPKAVRVYPRPIPLRQLPDPLRTQTSVGNYVAATVGDGLEPGEIRPFVPGDRVKQVNWRASLRLGGLHVTRHQEERNADVVLMLDTLSHVGTGTATTLNASVGAAASLAAAYLARKDRVGLIDYGGVFSWVRPGSGRAQLERLLDVLLRADVTFTYVTRDLALVPPRVLPPQALVIALSPLLDGRFISAARDLAARGFDLVVLAVDPVPFAVASLRFSRVAETAGRLWSLERRIQLGELCRHGLRVLEWNPAEPIDQALARLGRYRRRRAMAG